MTTELDTYRPAALAIRPGQEFWTDKQRAALDALGIKNATNADLAVFMHYCQKTALDPFSRQIYLINRRENQGGQWVDKQTIQVGIEGFRVIRDRAARRDGVDVEYEDTQWYDTEGKAHEVWIWPEAPSACRFVVLKGGKRFPAVLSFAEYVQTKNDKPVGKWRDSPAHQIEKCTEAFALRRAFPHDLGGIYIPEEMGESEAVPPGAIPNGNGGRLHAADVIRIPAEAPDQSVASSEQAGPADDRPPARAATGQLNMIEKAWRDRGFGDEDTEEVLAFTARMAGTENLGSLRDLTQDQARAVQDALGPLADRAAVVAYLYPGGEAR